MQKRHKGDTKAFDELNFPDKARSISAQILRLEAAIDHHINHSTRADTASICKEQVARLLQRLNTKYP